MKTCGTVKISTAFLGMFISLLLGLVLGSMLSEFLAPQTQQAAKESLRTQPVQTAQKANVSPQLQKRIAELEQAVNKDLKNPTLWADLGNAYFDAGEAVNAIHAYERALTLGKPSADLLTDLGIMYREIDRFEDAVLSFEQAMTLDRQHVQSRLNKGIVLYFDLSQKKEAIASFEEALAIKPTLALPTGEPLASFVAKLKAESN